MSRLENVEAELALYRKAINRIDDRIEYALSMPDKSRTALYEIIDELTKSLAGLRAGKPRYTITDKGRALLGNGK